MNQLEKLKSAISLHDVALLLGFQPKHLAYILYKKTPAEKYKQFEIPKRAGGVRTINAPIPELKTLQRRLSSLLQNCIEEINRTRKISHSFSHGFRRKHSIMTNARVHRKKRYVLNVDLENFFGTINFGRVRGFFISNRNFALNEKVATILAQIACHENVLPQGSPCSPVISNLIGHILDIPLAAFAAKLKCSYSRYADDLTLSTNRHEFPKELAFPYAENGHKWKVGEQLEEIITRAHFSVNASKTRLQYKDSRQEVTGLVVNAKVNTRSEYRRMARAMTHRLLKTGKFQTKQIDQDVDGKPVEKEVDGRLEQLNGMFSFNESVHLYNLRKRPKHKNYKVDKDLRPSEKPDAMENMYCNFLVYKYFYACPKPLIVCEGKTDNIYIKAAINKLADKYPQLATKSKENTFQISVTLFKYSKTTARILGLGGGTGDIKNFLNILRDKYKGISAPSMDKPVIFIIDNDEGAKEIYSTLNTITKSKVANRDSEFVHVFENIYIVPTPLKPDGKDTMIEDFFEESVTNTKLGEKVFNPSNKRINYKTEYSKNHFAEYVIKKNEDKINFSGFKELLTRIDQVIINYSALKMLQRLKTSVNVAKS